MTFDAMRILVVTNFYPPHYIGGYELGCYEAVQALRAAGHRVDVLTSNYGGASTDSDGSVMRSLHVSLGREMNVAHVIGREIYNHRAFRDAAKRCQPDIVYVWNLGQVSFGIIGIANSMHVPVAFYVFDDWVLKWVDSEVWIKRGMVAPGNLLTRTLAAFALRLLDSSFMPKRYLARRLKNAQFGSHFLKESAAAAGIPVHDSQVIHWGVDLDRFAYRSRAVQGVPARLLYVGQLVPHKGVHTAIEALAALLEKEEDGDLRLTLVGGTILPDYEARLRALVERLGLSDRIDFVGSVPREALPNVYIEHDIAIVPSVWDEPFGIVLLEAMASGLAVVGTATGGSAEILKDEVNGLVFEKDDPLACADRIAQLRSDAGLYERLRSAGRHTVEERFSIGRTVHEIEAALARSFSRGAKRTP
jgi:glycosyltransferase involved in cell wall biosynthesis